MQYLEDIIELVEDLPEEVEKRSTQIRQWDIQVERLRSECNVLANRLFEDHSLDKSDKENLVGQLGQKYVLMRELCEKKLDLATRSERLMMAIYDRVHESTYHCKIELEVDSPGITENIERHFCQTRGLRPSATPTNSEFGMEFEPLETFSNASLEESRSPSPAIFAPRPVGRPRNPLRHEPYSASSSPRPVGRPRILDKERANKLGKGKPGVMPGKKYKKRMGQTGQLSAYQRKKKEREREAAKTIAIHREREMRERERHMEQRRSGEMIGELASFCAEGGSNASVSRRDTPLDDGEADGDPPSSRPDSAWSNAVDGGVDPLDGLGSEDDFDLEADALGLFPAMLPSPPREIMESLKEDSLFGMDPFDSIGATSFGPMGGVSPAHSSPAPFSAYSHQQSEYLPMKNRDSLSSTGSAVSKLEREKEKERKKKSITFSNLAETSIHGRPRKLTNRAEELVVLTERKEREKKKIRERDELGMGGGGGGGVAEEDPNDGPWCFCRGSSHGDMVECESSKCRFQWFHFECLGLTRAPEGKWYCSECRSH